MNNINSKILREWVLDRIWKFFMESMEESLRHKLEESDLKEAIDEGLVDLFTLVDQSIFSKEQVQELVDQGELPESILVEDDSVDFSDEVVEIPSEVDYRQNPSKESV